MVIALSTRSLVKDSLEGYNHFIYETFRRIATSHPEHTFIFIFDSPWQYSLTFSPNVIPVITGRSPGNPVQWYIWYNIRIPLVLKKYKAEIFVGTDGLCSLTTEIPQCLLIPDLAFLHDSSCMYKSHLLFYKKFTPRSVKKSKITVTLSGYTKSAVISHYKTDAGKIIVVYGGVNDNFLPVSDDKKEHMKLKYADGNEYFIYTGEIGTHKNLLNLLKAFSAFKKRQRSSMQLLVAGKPGCGYAAFAESLRLFRFKEEVKVLEDLPLPEVVYLTASSYAMIYPSLQEGFGTQCLQAMKCGVPVITSPDSAMSEVCGAAALYADPGNYKDIAVKMMLLFKDETLRKALIEKAAAEAQKYNWNITATLMWNAIERTMRPDF